MSVIKEGTLKYQDDVWKEVSAQIEGNELIIKKKDKVITKSISRNGWRISQAECICN